MHLYYEMLYNQIRPIDYELIKHQYFSRYSGNEKYTRQNIISSKVFWNLQNNIY